MGDVLSGVTFLGVLMGFLAALLGFLVFIMGLNSLKWIFNKKIDKDAVGFSLTLGTASFIAGIAWPIFLFSQDYKFVAIVIFLSELFYIFYSFGRIPSRH